MDILSKNVVAFLACPGFLGYQPMTRAAKLLSLHLVLFLSAAAQAASVPPPSETPCEVIVNGRTSTLKSIEIRKTGQDVPLILHGPQSTGNTKGFEWYVSQHFAVKTDMGSDMAHHALTLAELSYPHYITTIGREPPGIATRRLPMVVASSLEKLQLAAVSDIGSSWIANGGGVTLAANWVPYIYPSGSLQYQINDIIIHENLHAFHFEVQGGNFTPWRFTEGITYMFAHHVYDPEKKQLTVAVFDKAPINNYTDTGLKAFKRKGIFSIEELTQNDKVDHPCPQMWWTAFFWSTPERLMKWRIWRDELLEHAPSSSKAVRTRDVETIRALFGGFDTLEQDWKTWAAAQHSSFTHVDWGWEQWGGALQSYGFPWDPKFFAQMDINFVVGEELKPDPLRMDYPQAPDSPLVGPVHFGATDPAIGCTIDFRDAKNHGWAGLGLGVQERLLLRIVVQDNKSLVIDGTALGFKGGKQNADFSPKLQAAAAKSFKTGLTVQIGHDALLATLRAGENNDIETQEVKYPLSDDERKILLERHIATLSKDGKHWITPYLDARLSPARDLSKPAGANRWGYAFDAETYRLYRAAWNLESKAPPELCALRDTLLKAMDQDETTQAAAGDAYRKQIGAVRSAVQALKTPAAARALWILSGLKLALRYADTSAGSTPQLAAYLWNGSSESVGGKVTFNREPNGEVMAPQEFNVQPHQEVALTWSPGELKGIDPLQFNAEAECTIDGITASTRATQMARRGIPAYWVIGPFDNKGDGTVDTAQPVENAEFDPVPSFDGKDKRSIKWQKVQRAASLSLASENVLKLDALWGDQRNASAYALVWVRAPHATKALLSCGSDDGLVVWLNGRKIHTALVNRGYSLGTDTVPIELNEGMNKFLFRVTQTWGGWCLGAEILDENEKPLLGLTYTLDPKQP